MIKYANFLCSILIFTLLSTQTFANNRVLIRFKDKATIRVKQRGYLKTLAESVTSYKNIDGLTKIEYKTKAQAEKAVELYKNDSAVEYVELDQPLYLLNAEANDPDFNLQWGLNNSGQTIPTDGPGELDIDINAPETWALTTGSSSVIIAVIDTGIEYNHEDIKGNLWTNLGETPGNGIDDDGNGYIDDIHGINAVEETGDPLDDHGHGTHVAGIIAATGNNKVGISGVLQTAKIVSCKFLDSEGSGLTSDAIQCLEYIGDLNVSVIATNNSWGGTTFSQSLYDAIKTHQDKGILFFAAAGNEGTDNDIFSQYPSGYDLTNIITVGAIDNKGALASFSNFGKFSVDVAAPGQTILSTFNSGYGYLSGTSMATPFVTGLAGIAKSHNPDWDWKNIRNLLLSTGKTLPSLASKTVTEKIVRGYDQNNSGVVNCVDQIVTKYISPKSASSSIEIGSEVYLSVLNINCENALGNIIATINQTTQIDLKDDGTGVDMVASDGIATNLWTPGSTGHFVIDFPENNRADIHVFDKSNWERYGTVSDPTYQYRDIEANGTALTTGDETIAYLVSPFSFPFAGGNSSNYHLYISSNGTISLTENMLTDFLNLNLAQPSWTALVSPYWDDLLPSPDNNNSGIFYSVLGTSPNRELVIEWRNMEHYEVEGSSASFQAIFTESNSSILFSYKDVSFGSSTYDNGKSATIGIQTDPNKFHAFSYNSETVANNYSLKFEVGDSTTNNTINPNVESDSNNNGETGGNNSSPGNTSGGGGGGGRGSSGTKTGVDSGPALADKPKASPSTVTIRTKISNEIPKTVAPSCNAINQVQLNFYFLFIIALWFVSRFLKKNR